jgi:hypothetical protein
MTDDHYVRLALIENRQNGLETRQSKLEEVLTKLAEDMHQIAVNTASMKDDKEAMKRLFEIIEVLEKRMDDKDKQEAAATILKLQVEANEQKEKANTVRVEFFKTLLLVIGTVTASLIVYHFGIKA